MTYTDTDGVVHKVLEWTSEFDPERGQVLRLKLDDGTEAVFSGVTITKLEWDQGERSRQ